jgi:hypothetical protein
MAVELLNFVLPIELIDFTDLAMNNGPGVYGDPRR